jgi:hypothetical protein
MQVTLSPGCRRGDTERPSDEICRGLLVLGKKQCRLVSATEVTPEYYGPLGAVHVQDMWVVGGIILPYTLPVPSFSKAETRDLRLFMVKARRRKGGPRSG